jgi:hypothetical protein
MIGKNGCPWLNSHTTTPSMLLHNKLHSLSIMVNTHGLERTTDEKFEMNQLQSLQIGWRRLDRKQRLHFDRLLKGWKINMTNTLGALSNTHQEIKFTLSRPISRQTDPSKETRWQTIWTIWSHQESRLCLIQT